MEKKNPINTSKDSYHTKRGSGLTTLAEQLPLSPKAPRLSSVFGNLLEILQF